MPLIANPPDLDLQDHPLGLTLHGDTHATSYQKRRVVHRRLRRAGCSSSTADRRCQTHRRSRSTELRVGASYVSRVCNDVVQVGTLLHITGQRRLLDLHRQLLDGFGHVSTLRYIDSARLVEWDIACGVLDPRNRVEDGRFLRHLSRPVDNVLKSR